MDLFTCGRSAATLWALLAALALSTPVAVAQTAATTTAGPQLQYKSVFGQYQAFTEQEVAPWRSTNDVVEKIGGWRVYAKEARAPDTDSKKALPEKQDVHSTHGMQGGKP